MENLMKFLRDKFYYIAGGFILFIIIIILVVACGGNKARTYEDIENNLVEAAKEYYSENKTELAKLDIETSDKNIENSKDTTAVINLSKLVEQKYMKEAKDPKNKKRICNGYVEVTKKENAYYYQPKLTCGKYTTMLINEKIMKSAGKIDENGNGLYMINSEYLYRGDKVKNYVKFNNTTWRIIKLDVDGNLKLIRETATEGVYVWDNRYNNLSQDTSGKNDFKISRIKDSLKNYYNKYYKNSAVSGLLVSKNFCVGKFPLKGSFDSSPECKLLYKMYVGLLSVSEFYKASTDPTCKAFGQEQCTNYNYLTSEDSSWTLNGCTNEKENNTVYRFDEEIDDVIAENEQRIRPVIFITNKAIYRSGNGTKSDPYIFN